MKEGPVKIDDGGSLSKDAFSESRIGVNLRKEGLIPNIAKTGFGSANGPVLR